MTSGSAILKRTSIAMNKQHGSPLDELSRISQKPARKTGVQAYVDSPKRNLGMDLKPLSLWSVPRIQVCHMRLVHPLRQWVVQSIDTGNKHGASPLIIGTPMASLVFNFAECGGWAIQTILIIPGHNYKPYPGNDERLTTSRRSDSCSATKPKCLFTIN